MESNLLSRIITGEATLEEKEKFYRKLSESKEEEELYYQVKSLWVRSSMYKNPVDVNSEFDVFWRKLKHPVKPASISAGKRLVQYAAIVLITLTIGGLAGHFFTKNTYQFVDSGIQKYTATKGSVSIVEFPDGTKVWLNSGTELTYREDIKNKQRLAELKGEAYFEVKHRDNCPMLVKTGHLVIRDLGTTFNIKAYPEGDQIETSLVEGEADILSEKGVSLVTLKPGESAVYSILNKSLDIRPVSQNVLSAWRDGKFVIRDQRLEDIFKELSRWYDVEFRFENQAIRDYRYTGNIKKSTTANHVLKMLKLTASFNYRIIEESAGSDVIIIY